MRCSFCNRRIRGEYIDFGERKYHHATTGERRHCLAAAHHYAVKRGLIASPTENLQKETA